MACELISTSEAGPLSETLWDAEQAYETHPYVCYAYETHLYVGYAWHSLANNFLLVHLFPLIQGRAIAVLLWQQVTVNMHVCHPVFGICCVVCCLRDCDL